MKNPEVTRMEYCAKNGYDCSKCKWDVCSHQLDNPSFNLKRAILEAKYNGESDDAVYWRPSSNRDGEYEVCEIERRYLLNR